MIKLLRLDERLIHGQVAIKWSRHLNVDRIIVANDAAAGNAVVQKSLMMAAPATAKVAIKTVDQVIEMMKNPKAADHDILMLVNNPADLIKMMDNLNPLPVCVDVGNYGRIAMKKTDGSARVTYRRNLYLYPEEKEVLAKVLNYGVECIYQTVPDEAAEPLDKVLG